MDQPSPESRNVSSSLPFLLLSLWHSEVLEKSKPVANKQGSEKASWQAEHRAFRQKHGLGTECPWTSVKPVRGLYSKRARDCVDICAGLNPAVFQEDTDMVVDVSQTVSRCRWTVGAPTLTTSASLFLYREARLLTGIEHMMLMGFNPQVAKPKVADSNLKNLAGEAMAVPVISSITLALVLALDKFFEVQRPRKSI